MINDIMRRPELSSVTLARPIASQWFKPDGTPEPAITIPAGTGGVIVHVHEAGAYEVEFSQPVRSVATMTEDDLEPEVVELDDMTDEQKRIIESGQTIGGTFPHGLTRDELSAWMDQRFPTSTITPEQIIQAALDPPAATLRITEDTTDEELSEFIRGPHRT
jgi:hypothetical protein